MTDQQRADAMGCSGGWLKTPNLDRIAVEGVCFSLCVTTTPICVPARVTLATGRYPHNNAVWNNLRYTLPEDASTWMRVIRDLGYRTSLFGKTHLHPHGDVDLREREYLLHAYGLDDVNEIGGPRASARIGSHMTAMWEEKGVWEAYRADFKERFDNKPHVVRPSVLPLELYYDVYVGQCAKQYLKEYRSTTARSPGSAGSVGVALTSHGTRLNPMRACTIQSPCRSPRRTMPTCHGQGDGLTACSSTCGTFRPSRRAKWALCGPTTPAAFP